MTCDPANPASPCAIAERDPLTGLIRAGCPECAARALSQGMPFWYSQRAGSLTPEYRRSLEVLFGSRWSDGHARAKAWAQRIAAARPVQAAGAPIGAQQSDTAAAGGGRP